MQRNLEIQIIWWYPSIAGKLGMMAFWLPVLIPVWCGAYVIIIIIFFFATFIFDMRIFHGPQLFKRESPVTSQVNFSRPILRVWTSRIIKRNQSIVRPTLALGFPLFASATCICFEFWIVSLNCFYNQGNGQFRKTNITRDMTAQP